MCDLSALGVRLGRPFDPSAASRRVQLEIELPEVDEIIWAHGDVTFAHLSPMGGAHENGDPRLWCEGGVQLRGISTSERRFLRVYVVEARRRRQRLESEVDDGIPIYWHAPITAMADLR